MNPFSWNSKIVVLGAGDRGTATALRLFNSGLQPVLIECNHPTDLHYNRNFSDVVYREKKIIENVQAASIMVGPSGDDWRKQVEESFANRVIPVLNIPGNQEQDLLTRLKPEILVDCARRLTKTPELGWQDFPCVIRIGFKFNVGVDGHFVIGDNDQYCGMVFQTRHDMIPDITGTDDVYQAPIEGLFQTEKRIGDAVMEREKIGMINSINILAPSSGFLNGLLHSGHFISTGQPLFELVPARKSRDSGSILPVRCRTIAGGILEAVIKHLYQIHR